EILDAIVESDYAVIDAIYVVVELQETTQSQVNEVEAVMNIMEEVIAIVNPILQDTTVEEYNAMIDLIFGQITIQLEMQNQLYDTDISYNTEMLDIIGYIETGIKNTSVNQLNIFKDLMSLMVESNYISDFSDFVDNGNIGSESDEYYGAMILLANAYLEFYNDSENDINAVIDETMNVLSEADIRVELDLTSTDLEEIETTINSFFTDSVSQANIIKDYDYNNLTSTQKANVDVFVSTFGIIIFGIMM
nr:hypothetical protein [Mycoplasmatota bacterium]